MHKKYLPAKKSGYGAKPFTFIGKFLFKKTLILIGMLI
jgi:hypothetical protein